MKVLARSETRAGEDRLSQGFVFDKGRIARKNAVPLRAFVSWW